MRSGGNIALATHRTVAAVASHLKKPVLITLARVAGAALAFALQLVLARSLSQDHLGIYFTAISAATVLAMGFGLRKLIDESDLIVQVSLSQTKVRFAFGDTVLLATAFKYRVHIQLTPTLFLAVWIVPITEYC